jgi:iron complex outermembrane receptor protein
VTGLLGRVVFCCAALSAYSAWGAEPAEEEDSFGQLPIVLTVSRLAQPISDTPGAVTIIDRDKIHRSGARDITDVLRLVPGYMVAGANGANVTASYHAPLDELGIRSLVMVDGRSVYSPFVFGDTHYGLMGVMLEDVERIEILRGSNSVAYGANAMFGVINIITRHTQDTKGTELSISGGEGGISDNQARIGWGDDKASYRLSMSRQKDSGYLNAYDDHVVSRVHFRSDLHPTLDNDFLLEAGVNETHGEEGTPGSDAHTVVSNNTYLHGQWRHQLSETDELKVTASYDEEHRRDQVTNPNFYHGMWAVIDQSGSSRRLNLEAQHQIGLSPTLRAVWGAGYQYEDAQSPTLYSRSDTISLQETRLFGNLEWRFHPMWLLNAGLFVGNNSWTGTYSAPRLMANFTPISDHTFRIGATKSERSPNLMELAGNMSVSLNGVLPVQIISADGKVRPEVLTSQEMGYFGNFRELNTTLDVRIYHENVKDVVAADGLPANFVNNQSVKAKGIEYELRWHPIEETEIWANQNFQHYEYWDTALRTDRQPPTHATTLALFQKLPKGLDFTLSYTVSGRMNWRGVNNAYSPERLDARLAYPFHIGATKAELAVTVQSVYGDQPIFLPANQYLFQRKAFATLRLDF